MRQTNSEARDPKPERNPKAEVRIGLRRVGMVSGISARSPFGLRISGFGFGPSRRIVEFLAAARLPDSPSPPFRVVNIFQTPCFTVSGALPRLPPCHQILIRRILWTAIFRRKNTIIPP